MQDRVRDLPKAFTGGCSFLPRRVGPPRTRPRGGRLCRNLKTPQAIGQVLRSLPSQSLDDGEDGFNLAGRDVTEDELPHRLGVNGACHADDVAPLPQKRHYRFSSNLRWFASQQTARFHARELM